MNEEKYIVYILYSETFDVYYKGITHNIEKRIIEHNENKSRYSSGKGPWQLVYQRQYTTKKEALIEEKRVKKLNRVSIKLLLTRE